MKLNVFKNKIERRSLYLLIASISFLSTVISLIQPIQSAFKSNNKILGSLYIFFFFFVLIIVISLKPKPKIKMNLTKSIFHGAGEDDNMDIWPRKDDEKEVLNTITQNVHLPIILVGSSGVGKSILIKKRIIPQMKSKGWHTIFFENYTSFIASFHSKLSEVTSEFSDDEFFSSYLTNISCDKKLFLVFDQFEQFLSKFGDVNKNENNVKIWFRELLENSTKNENIRFLIVVRKEWYYDLRFLNNFIPPPIKSIHLNGFDKEKNESGRLILKSKFEKATNNGDIEFIINDLQEEGEILPIQAQIVGLMLENESKKVGIIDKNYYIKELGSKDSLIHRYLKLYIESSPDKDISMKVLFALSIEKKLRKQISITVLSEIIHKKTSEVNDCIRFFINEGLIRHTDSGSYELYHDYLAEKFHELSGSELDPVERDNILFFYDNHKKNKEYKTGTLVNEKSHKIIFSDYFLGFLLLLLVMRVFSPLYNSNWDWFNDLYAIKPNQKLLDIYYIPVFVSHLAWSIYVTMLYRRFFFLLKESWLARLFSKITVINTTICVIIATFWPYYFILSIGWGGFLLGFKLLQLSFKSGLNKISVNYYRSMAFVTLINMLVVISIGIVMIYWFSRNDFLQDSSLFIITLYFSSIILTYFMLAIRVDHTSKNASSKMLGLIDRVSLNIH